MNNIYGIDTNHHHPVTDWFKVKSYLASKNLSTINCCFAICSFNTDILCFVIFASSYTSSCPFWFKFEPNFNVPPLIKFAVKFLYYI